MTPQSPTALCTTWFRRLGLLGVAVALSACTATGQEPGSSNNSLVDGFMRNFAKMDIEGAGGMKMSIGPGATGGGPNDTVALIGLLKQSVESIDEAKEIEIGRQLAATLLGARPALKNEAVQRYVNQLGRWISLQSARPGLPWTFVVLDDSGVNAFAAPGGYIFITRGLLVSMQSEAELGGVLGHEIAHVVEKHHLKALSKAARAGLLTRVVGSQISGVGGAVTNQLMDMGVNLYSKGLERGDEFDADRKGVVLAARSGLDPYGLPSVLQMLASMRPDDPNVALMFSTHPPTGQRLELLETAMGTRLDGMATGKPVTLDQRLKLRR